MNIPVVSSQWFSGLPEEYQAIVEEEAVAAGKMASDEIANVEEPRIREELKAKGITIVPPEEIDIEAFKAAGDKAYEALGLVEVRAEAYKQLGKTRVDGTTFFGGAGHVPTPPIRQLKNQERKNHEVSHSNHYKN